MAESNPGLILSAESDEIADSKSFSGIAFVSFLASLVGLFSILYVHLFPIAVAAAAGGAIAVSIARRYQLSNMSIVFGTIAIALGTTAASWGAFSRSLWLDYDLQQARKIAQLYLDNLSAGNMDTVKLLVGFQLEASEVGGKVADPESKTAQAMKKLEQDPAHVEIRSRKTPAKWVYAGFEMEFAGEGTMGHTYKLRFRDEGQTNPPEYWVYTRMTCPKGGPAKMEKNKGKKLEPEDMVIYWFVDSLEAAKKL